MENIIFFKKMYVYIDKQLLIFIRYENSYIICTNNINTYKIPFSDDVKFLSSIDKHINHDLLDLILQKFSKVEKQMTFTTLNSFIFNRLIIKKLNISLWGYKINDQMLHNINCYTQEYLWYGLIKLKSYSSKIKDVNFLSDSLRILKTSGSFNIDQSGIQRLQLIKLKVKDNNFIRDVSFMKDSLRVLSATGFRCGIDQNGIEGLQLIKLDVEYNRKIRDVNFMASTLRILKAPSDSGIDQAGIQNLQLIELDANDNEKITDVSFMKDSLRVLDASGFSGIDQVGIQGLKLVELNARLNKKIITESF